MSERKEMKKIRIILLVTAIMLIVLSGCETPLYSVKLQEKEKQELTQIAQEYLLEQFGESMTKIENCYVTALYSDRRRAEKDKDNWNICVYGTGEDGTVYNVVLHYTDRRIVTYSARYTNGLYVSSMDEDDRSPVKENRTLAANVMGLSETDERVRSVVSAMNSVKAYRRVEQVQKIDMDGQTYLKVVYEDATYGVLMDEDGFAVGVRNLEDDTWPVEPEAIKMK